MQYLFSVIIFIVLTVSTLHNFCIIANQRFPEKSLQRIDTESLHDNHPTRFFETGGDSKGIRNSIKHYMTNTYDKL